MSAQAAAFLEQMPTAEQLMPTLDASRIASLLPGGNPLIEVAGRPVGPPAASGGSMSLINIKFRALVEKAFTQVPGAEAALYGLDDIASSNSPMRRSRSTATAASGGF
jgi:hypothetical protein